MDVTKIVVNTLVISSFNAVNVPLLPFFPAALALFSSSSANSRTFHGYNVVIAISAAWNNANAVNMTNHINDLPINSFFERGTMTASGSIRLTIPPDAWATFLVVVRSRVAKVHNSKPYEERRLLSVSLFIWIDGLDVNRSSLLLLSIDLRIFL